MIVTLDGKMVLPVSDEYRCCVRINNNVSTGINVVGVGKFYQIECDIHGSRCIPDILGLPTQQVFEVNLDMNFVQNVKIIQGEMHHAVSADHYDTIKFDDDFQYCGYKIQMITESFKIDVDPRDGSKWKWTLVTVNKDEIEII